MYCAIAEAVPTVVSDGFTRPTGRFWALETGVNVPSALRTANVTFAVRMSPWHGVEVSCTVALSVKLAVLLVALVVQKKLRPVYNGWPVSGAALVFEVIAKLLELFVLLPACTRSPAKLAFALTEPGPCVSVRAL